MILFCLFVASPFPIYRFKAFKNISCEIKIFRKDLMYHLVDKIYVTNVLGKYLIVTILHLS